MEVEVRMGIKITSASKVNQQEIYIILRNNGYK